MTHSTHDHPRELSRAAYVMTAVLAAFLVMLAVFGFTSPIAAARGFGIPLAAAADDAFVFIKAGRDLTIGAMLAGLLLAGRRGPLAAVIAATLISPINDCLQVAARGELAYALAVHGSAVAYGVVLLWVLRRR